VVTNAANWPQMGTRSIVIAPLTVSGIRKHARLTDRLIIQQSHSATSFETLTWAERGGTAKVACPCVGYQRPPFSATEPGHHVPAAAPGIPTPPTAPAFDQGVPAVAGAAVPLRRSAAEVQTSVLTADFQDSPSRFPAACEHPAVTMPRKL